MDTTTPPISKPDHRVLDPQADPAAEPDHGRVFTKSIFAICPAPENDDVYQALSADDPDVTQLAKSIAEHGIQEPILISRDGFILSGHRRRFAARMVGLTEVPVRVHPVSRTEDPEAFLRLLVEMNTQRIKSASVLVKESMIKTDPKAAHRQIVNDRKQKNEDRLFSDLSAIDPDVIKKRCRISKAKQPLMNAIIKIIEEHRRYWPLTRRQIHYRLLGPDAPLTHASKPDSKYRNDDKSYDKLEILTRMRIDGIIPWEAIEDKTRPLSLNEAFWNTAEFFRQEFKSFLSGYWRHRQQSQPHHRG
jgi:hypothetical protein